MKTPTLFRILGCLVLIFHVSPGYPQGGSVASAPVGFTKVVCPGGSDTPVSVPFHQEPTFSGLVGDSLVVSSEQATLEPASAANLVANALTDRPHYLRIRSGAFSGAWFPVVSNTGDDLTIMVGLEDVSSVAQGDAFDVIPHWTFHSLFPPGEQETIHESSGLLPTGRGTRVMLADVSTEGIQLAPNRIFFLTADGWVTTADGFASADDVLIEPGQVLVIRHPENAEDTEFCVKDRVHLFPHRTLLRTSTNGEQDNHLGLVRPVAVKLSDLDLDAPVFVDSDSTTEGDRKDELLVYDNLLASINKEPSTVYFRVSGSWRRDDGGSFPDAGDESISPTSALVIRKSATATGEALVWINSPRY